MFQSLLLLLHEWLRRPSWVAIVGFAGGFFLFLIGVIWKVPCDRKLGLVVMGLCIIAGTLLFFYG